MAGWMVVRRLLMFAALNVYHLATYCFYHVSPSYSRTSSLLFFFFFFLTRTYSLFGCSVVKCIQATGNSCCDGEMRM